MSLKAKRWRGIAVVATAATMLSAGCGGGSGSSGPSSTNVAAARQAVSTGQQQMNALLTNQQATTSSSVSAVTQTFQTAYNDDPTNNQAQFGYAIGLVANSAESAAATLQLRSTSTDPLSSTIQSLTLRNLSSLNLLSPSTIKNLLAAPFATRAITRGPSPSEIRAALSAVQSALATALPVLDKAAADSSFSFQVQYKNSSTGATQTITIDQADVLTVDSALYSIDAMLEMVLAYNFDPGTFDFNQPISSLLHSEISASSTITASEYLPPSPFGSPMSNSGSLFAAAKGYINTAVTRATSAVTAYSARTSQTGHLFNPTNWSATTVQADINTFSNDFNHPFTVNVEGSTVTINLQAWFATQPNFRSLQPKYHPVSGSSSIVAGSADFPDLTFGGIVSNLPGNVFNINLSTYDSVSSMYVPVNLVNVSGYNL